MNNKKKRFRQAAACFLAAALTISSGPGVFSPAAEESETVWELSETDTELTAGAAEDGLTETSTEPETEEQTREEAPQEMETQERETETSAETETDPADEPESQPDSEPETPEAENQTGQSEAGTEPQESMTEEESGSGEEGDESVSEGETPQEPVEEEPETKATEETTIPAETPAPATNAVLKAGSTEQTESSVAKVEMNGTVTYYDNLNEAVDAINDVYGTGAITLLQNASLTGWNVKSIYGNIILIGNNYTINGDYNGIPVYGTLSIENCNFSDSIGTFYSYSGGTINCNGGNYNTVQAQGGTINIYGGNFQRVVGTMGTVNVYGGTIETSLGNINYYYTAPEPTFTTTQTADSITVEVRNYQDVYGEIQYQWDNGEWGTNNTLLNLGANSEHTVSVRYMGQNNYQPSKETQPQTVRSAPATFTITIPASVTATRYDKPEVGGTISVDKSKAFDLGYNGKVVIYGSYRTMGIDLYRQNDPQSNALYCFMHTGNAVTGENHYPPVGGSKSPVAIFDEISNTADINVYAQIENYSDDYLAAGTYSGTTTFTTEYTEDPNVDYGVEVSE